MATNPQEPAGDGRNGLDLSNVLRDCLACAIITVDSRQKVTGLNPHAERLLRIKVNGKAGRNSSVLPDSLRDVIHETFASGKPTGPREILLPGAADDETAVQVTTHPIRPDKGKVSGAVVVLNDVSTTRNWESNLRRLDRLHNIVTLSASMAHEVKNAFVAIKTFVDLLLEQNKQADLAEVVRFEMRRIDTILGQMRRVSGPVKPAFAPIQLRFVLEKSLLLIHHLLEEKKIKVTRRFAASPDLVNGDSDQLEQAFLNLFFNALDAMKPDGQLTVSTDIVPPGTKIPGLSRKKNSTFLRVTVQDNGCGIPAAYVGQLFEPFFTTKPEGTGLGLPITRRIIEEHGGAVTVQSELNQGTAFSLILPASNGA